MKTHQMFSVHTTLEEFQNEQSPAILDLRKTPRQRNIMIIVTSSFFLQASFPKCSLSSLNAKPAFTNSSGLKSAFKKLHFRDGLVWTEELTKLRFQIPPANNEPLFFLVLYENILLA